MIVGLALWMAAAPAAASAPSAAAKALVQNCDAHRFETTITYTSGGQAKQSKVKMCGTEGQSDADWLLTLRDAIDKTAANPKMPQAVKDQIIGAVKAEIARIDGGSAIALPVTTDISKPRNAPPVSRQDFAALPPLPTAPTVAPPSLLKPGASLISLPKPNLTIECQNSSDLAGAGPCTGFERDTLVTVRAGENLPAGTRIRFARSGEASGEVDVAKLARGRSLRFSLPSEVCSGVGGGRLEVQIVRSGSASDPGQVVGSEGPFNLRC